MDKFLPFALPDIGEEEIDEVVDSLRSGWLTTGPKTSSLRSRKCPPRRSRTLTPG